MTIAVFDPAAFKLRFPEFASVSDTVLSEIFHDAELYLDNTDASPVQDVAKRLRLLNLLVAHIAKLSGVAGLAGAGSSASGAAPVGLLGSATEGSVSVSYDTSHIPKGSAFWFNQTQYGAMWWQSTLYLRTFRYISQPTRY